MTHEKQERRYRYGPGAPCVDEIERDAKAKQERIQGQGGATPGPWEVRKARTMLHIVGADGHCVTSISTTPPKVPEQEIRDSYTRVVGPNAKLIAAAPELADALEALLDDHVGPAKKKGPGRSSAELLRLLSDAREQARAALRKAGRE